MAKLTLRYAGGELEHDITNKNLMAEISRLLPKKELPDGFSYDDLVVHIGGRKVNLRTYDICKSFDCDVIIFAIPQGLAGIAAAVIISVVASIALAPEIPLTESPTDSPNNGLFGQTNVIRLDELEPNMYGKNVSYPDSIVQEGGSWEYVSNQKIITQIFNVGTGSYDKGEPRFELTPLSTITGSSFTYFEPGATIPIVQGQFNSEFIDGQTLLGPNNDEITEGVTATADPTAGTMTIIADVLSVDVDKNAEWDTIFTNVGMGIVTVSFTYEASMQDPTPSCTIKEFQSTGQILSMVDNGLTYTISINAEGATKSNCTSGPAGYGNLLICTEITDISITVVLPVKTNEVQISFDFRSGLRGSADVAVIITESTGQERYDFSYSSDTINQLFFTEKIAISPPPGDLEVTLTRLNDDKEDNTDRIQVSQIATNSYRTSVTYDGITTLRTERKATEAALRTPDSKINLECTRKTISYDINTGMIIPTLTASRSFADAILHEYTVVRGLSKDDLPLDEMYSIYDSLPLGLGFFDHTFADKQESIKQSLDTIANVARCEFPYYGDGYQIIRDEPKLPVIQFDSRNIDQSSPEEVSYRNAGETSNDGVKLKWRNPDGNKFEYVYYVIQGANSVECIHQGGGAYIPSLPKIPYEPVLTGCSELNQAKDRCDLECRKLIFIQKTLKITTLVDGENVTRGQVVKHVEYYEDDIDSGEISAIAGNVFTSYAEMNLVPGGYFVTYTDDIGNVFGPVACTIIDKDTFTASMPEAYLANGFTIQSGTRFMISTIEQHESSLYIVSDKTSEANGLVSLELIEYNDLIYP